MTLRFLAICLLVLSSSALGQRVADKEAAVVPAQRRELTSFWSLLFLVGPGPAHDECGCHKGPLGDHCRRDKGVTSSSQCSSSSGGSGGSSSSSSSASTTNGYSGDDGSGGGGGGSSSSSANSNSNNGSNPDGSRMIDPNGFSFWMIIAAAVAAAFAVGAVVMGQRKTEKEPHPLSGSVARRMGLFSNFADSALCNTAERPARVVEMTMSKEDYSMA